MQPEMNQQHNPLPMPPEQPAIIPATQTTGVIASGQDTPIVPPEQPTAISQQPVATSQQAPATSSPTPTRHAAQRRILGPATFFA